MENFVNNLFICRDKSNFNISLYSFLVKIFRNEVIYELPSSINEDTFTIGECRKYSIWLKSILFSNLKIRGLGITIVNKNTGKKSI